MTFEPRTTTSDLVFTELGELSQGVRSHNWMQTSLGSPIHWSSSLLAATRRCLASPVPTVLFWGIDFVQIYNMAYARLLEDTGHSPSLGQPANLGWANGWQILVPLLETVRTTGQTIQFAYQRLERGISGTGQEAYFTFSYSPYMDDSGSSSGIVCEATETTDRVVAARRLRTLRSIAPAPAALEETSQQIIEAIAQNPYDIPFALIYRLEEGNRAQQIAVTDTAPPSPSVVDLALNAPTPWQLAVAHQWRQPVLLQDSAHPPLATPKADGDSFHPGLTVPLLGLSQETVVGFLVLGISPQQPWDETYQDFLAVVSHQVQTAIAHADACIRDLAQQREAEQALRESEERLSLANERFLLAAKAVSALIYDWDFERDRVERTEGLVRLTGYTVEEAEPTARWWSDRIHPEDLPRIWDEALTATAHGDYFACEYRVRHRENYYIHVLDQALVVARDDHGKPKRIVGSTIDISDRKRAEANLRQSEERYRYLAESIPQLVWTADAQGIMLDVNQRWLNYTGVALSDIQQGGWQLVVHPDDIPTLTQQWIIAQQTHRPYQSEGRMRRRDGIYRWHLHQAVPLMDDQGQAMKWFGTATDIEDQKQLQQQRDRILQQEQVAREQAESANRIKDEFLAVLSHELRSPLNPILGWTKLLRSRQLDEKTSDRALETIERNAKLQVQLIEDLLDISRILRGKMVLNVTPVDLVEVIESALETVNLSAEAKGIRIYTLLPSTMGQVLGDATRLQQIVWNLLSNAIKFTAEGGQVEVKLDLIPKPHPSSPIPHSTPYYAQITVTDTGKGISPQFLPHLFEYFRQEDSATTRRFGGLGVGLAIVRHLTELHGGTVTATSNGEGQGAAFTVTLPLLSQGVEPYQIDPPAPSSANLSGVHILVVDDEADVRELVSFILEQAGAEVSTANSAAEALAVLKHVIPDGLVCDIGMPGMDGYALIRHIRDMPPEQGGCLPAIALTAYAGELNQRKSVAAGFQRHLDKPVEPDILVQTVATTIRECQENKSPQGG